MRFALLGNHPDGLAFARALVESGRHELLVYSGPASGVDVLRQNGIKRVGDLEEVLADPAVEAVIVAGRPADRPVQLRRAVQSERPVLCVHPADATADIAYEAAMIQRDTGHLLLPMLPEALHPGVSRLTELVKTRDGPLGEVRLIELERLSPDCLLIDTDPAGHKPSLPGWDVLRALGGEIAEVSAFATLEEVNTHEPLLMTGRYENGLLFRATFLPQQAERRWQLTVTGSRARVMLSFPQGWPGPARLTWQDEAGAPRDESWDAWEPWPAMLEVFETALGHRPAVGGAVRAEGGTAITAAKPASRGATGRLSWQDEVRCLELDEAVRRSVHYRRASTLEYQEASEEVGFKGTMTLLGCGLFWGILLLLCLSAWEPRLGWLIVPLLVVFLVLQLLRWLIPRR
jgi:predicted dehydrogenase